jgi:hypothetical protein
MKGYRPSIESQKRRYSLKLAMERLRKPSSPNRPRIVDNSEPWQPSVRTLSDAIRISDQIKKARDDWSQL